MREERKMQQGCHCFRSHLEDDVLGGGPAGQISGQLYSDHLRGKAAGRGGEVGSGRR